MINQVILLGKVTEIYEDSFNLTIIKNDLSMFTVTIYKVSEDTIAMLLLNNTVSIKGHLDISNNGILNVVLDNLIILDKRGKRR